MLVAKSQSGGPVTIELVIGLAVERTARFVVGENLRVNSRVIEDSLAGNLISVRALDGDVLAEEISETEGVGPAARARVFVSGVGLRESETQQIVPARCGLILHGRAEIGVLIFLRRIVGDSVEIDRVGRA